MSNFQPQLLYILDYNDRVGHDSNFIFFHTLYFSNFIIIPDIIITDFNTDYSYRKNLTWKSVSTYDTGEYECRATRIKDEFSLVNKYLSVIVHGDYNKIHKIDEKIL